MALMTSHDESPHSVRLHPWIFKAVAAFVLWMVIAAWGFTKTWSGDPGESYTPLVLAFISTLCLVAVGIAYLMGRFTLSSPDPARRDDAPDTLSFHDWKSREIEVGDGHQRGSHVAIDILLPPAAVAIDMTAFVLVWHLVPA